MTKLFAGRWTARHEGPFLVFLIGMRINRVRMPQRELWPDYGGPGHDCLEIEIFGAHQVFDISHGPVYMKIAAVPTLPAQIGNPSV